MWWGVALLRFRRANLSGTGLLHATPASSGSPLQVEEVAITAGQALTSRVSEGVVLGHSARMTTSLSMPRPIVTGAHLLLKKVRCAPSSFLFIVDTLVFILL